MKFVNQLIHNFKQDGWQNILSMSLHSKQIKALGLVFPYLSCGDNKYGTTVSSFTMFFCLSCIATLNERLY